MNGLKKQFFAIGTIILVITCSLPVFAKDNIVDWNGKSEGEEQIPSWLRTMRRGNALAYCQEFGLNSKINRKWIIPAGADSYIGWEDGLIAAQAQSMAAVGESIATDIIATLDSSVNNGAKNNIRRSAIKSVTTVAGLEYEGCHWYEEVKEVISGRNKKGKEVKSKQHIWHVYAFYSMDMQAYDTQVKTSLITILRDSGLTKEEAQAVAATSYEVVSSEKRATAAHDKKIAEEQTRLLNEHNRSLENRKMTMQEQGQQNQFNIDNRNIDTQQQQLQEQTKQIESSNRASVEIARTNAGSQAVQSIAGANTSYAQSGVPESSDTDINNAMAFLLGL